MDHAAAAKLLQLCLTLCDPVDSMRSIQIVLPPVPPLQWYLELTAKWPAGLPGHQVGANIGCYFCSQETKFTITAQSVAKEVGVPPSYLAIKCLLRGGIISQMGVKELGPGTGVLPGPLNERTSPGRCQEVYLVQGDAEAHRLSLS